VENTEIGIDSMSDIVRKNGQIIFKTQLPLSLLLLTVFEIGFTIPPLLMILSFIGSLNTNTLEIFCNKVEPKLVDCQFTTVPELGILPSSTKTYKGIKGVEYLKETETKKNSEGDSYTVTYYYVIFNQIPGKNKVQFDDRAQWVVSQINQFLNSDQETLKQTSSREPIASYFQLYSVVLQFMFIHVGVFIVANVIFYQSIDINNNLRQVVRTRIIPFYRKTLSFSDIKRLALIELIDEDGDKSYKLEIHTNKNEKIDLWSVSKEEEANRLAREICRLTGFRLIEQRLPS
jgi:hypothetical protein